MNEPRSRNLLNHEQRLQWLERRDREHHEAIRDLTVANAPREELDSNVGVSVSPGRVRVFLENVPPWVIAVFLILLAGNVALAIRLFGR